MSKCGACGYVSMSLNNKHTVYKVMSIDGTFYRCSLCLNKPYGTELDKAETNMSEKRHIDF